ncbi:Uncharacterized protein APZ42_001901 [Daphnia magna]|uniref:Uncharacterized protein n=1 Tax=Daphnia magna TaxID=35525 RepID=A0A164IND7_9CRUS|nr:Uncharacterized protein APZ42_001901 [Daphnia magna]
MNYFFYISPLVQNGYIRLTEMKNMIAKPSPVNPLNLKYKWYDVSLTCIFFIIP